MNISEVETLTAQGGKAQEAWELLLAAHRAFEAANEARSRNLWRESVKLTLKRARALADTLEALLEVDGE